MATPAQDLKHYHLPSRIRAERASDSGLTWRLTLADQIASLPNIHSVEDLTDTLPCRVNVYIHSPTTSIRRRHDAHLLCTISSDGVRVHGLGEWDRHQVLRGGWGRLERDHVFIFLPRNREELDVCWGMLQRAYQYLSSVSAVSRSVRVKDLPRFSRTALQ